eukprot:gb/GECH01010817.1/.p1 GENE.gb/GECH01010817.1/~~gb/GECH01010817.1/.p1  ORF type:complete len:668 (+),score=115.84 gb/GECH01010817.1/:1-2004(+)
MKIQFQIIILILLINFISFIYCQNDIYVSPENFSANYTGDGTMDNPYTHIEDALDAAADQDHIRLLAGRFQGLGNVNITSYRSLTFSAVDDDPTNTIIDCQSSVEESNIYGFRTRPSATDGNNDIPSDPSVTVTFRGLSFTDCHTSLTATYTQSLTVENCIFESNQHAIAVANTSSLVVTDSSFIRNQPPSSTPGAGITVLPSLLSSQSSTEVTIDSSRFTRNQASIGAALLFRSAEASVRNTVFEANQVRRRGIIYIEDGSIEFTESRFTGNRATRGSPAVLELRGASGTWTSCLARDNHATGSGGVISLPQPESRGTLINCTFLDNSAGVGGVISAVRKSHLTIEGNSRFENNQAETLGGALLVQTKATASVSDTGFFSNAVSQRNGGAIGVRDATLTLSSSDVQNNRASKNGGAFLIADNGTLTLESSSVSDNSAERFGDSSMCNSAYLNIDSDSEIQESKCRPYGIFCEDKCIINGETDPSEICDEYNKINLECRYTCPDCVHGSCSSNKGYCECEEGWIGDLCDTVPCESPDCNGHGNCNNGTCICDGDFNPDLDCAELKCIPECINGQCVNGTCACELVIIPLDFVNVILDSVVMIVYWNFVVLKIKHKEQMKCFLLIVSTVDVSPILPADVIEVILALLVMLSVAIGHRKLYFPCSLLLS